MRVLVSTCEIGLRFSEEQFARMSSIFFHEIHKQHEGQHANEISSRELTEYILSQPGMLQSLAKVRNVCSSSSMPSCSPELSSPLSPEPPCTHMRTVYVSPFLHFSSVPSFFSTSLASSSSSTSSLCESPVSSSASSSSSSSYAFHPPSPMPVASPSASSASMPVCGPFTSHPSFAKRVSVFFRQHSLTCVFASLFLLAAAGMFLVMSQEAKHNHCFPVLHSSLISSRGFAGVALLCAVIQVLSMCRNCHAWLRSTRVGSSDTLCHIRITRDSCCWESMMCVLSACATSFLLQPSSASLASLDRAVPASQPASGVSSGRRLHTFPLCTRTYDLTLRQFSLFGYGCHS